MNSYSFQKVLILGFGITGQAVAKYFLDREAEVIAVDQNFLKFLNDPAFAQKNLSFISEKEALLIHDYEVLILSPGIPPQHPICQKALTLSIPVMGEIELALNLIKNPVIAITGTNGKTTTTELTTHILNSQGLKAVSLGNIGRPLIGELKNLSEEMIVVLELSSFQIETLTTKAIDFAVLLNITPDHLDRYSTMEEYSLAKIKLGKALKSSGKFICEEKCYRKYRKFFSDMPVMKYGYNPQCEIYTDKNQVFFEGRAYELPAELAGRENPDLENMLASWAVCQFFAISFEHFVMAFKQFKKPRHRLEFVADIQGILFYDDSKGTNLDAVLRAAEQFTQKIILIAGGIHKGASYEVWREPFQNKVKAICAIGQAAKMIKQDLNDSIPTKCFETLEHAVYHAKAIAEKGDVVLLSPGCSSYDMFKDYAHRGDAFQKIVHELAEKCSFPMDIIKK